MCHLKARIETLKYHSHNFHVAIMVLKPCSTFFFVLTKPIKPKVHITVSTCAMAVSLPGSPLSSSFCFSPLSTGIPADLC